MAHCMDMINRVVIFFMAALTAFLGTSTALGQADNHNAATWYQQAIEQYNTLSEGQREAILEYLEHPDAPPSPQVRATLAQAQGILTAIRSGVAQEHNDNHLAYEQGFELLLPHLSPMRGIARLMSADAMIRMQDGDAGGAADRLAEMYRMSGHLGDDRVLISSLVGQAIFSLSDRMIQAGLDRGIFTPEQTASMIGALKWLGTDDPFNYVECIASEQSLAGASLEKAANSPEELQKLAAILGEGNNPELLLMDEASYRTALGQYDQMMDRVSEGFSSDNPEQAKAILAQVQQDVEAGLYGPLASALAPAFGKILERKLEASDKIAQRLELLEKFAGGQATVADVANAAVYYLRGIDLLSRVDPERMKLVRTFAADPSGEITGELSDALQKSADAIAQFRYGSTIKRCDFKAIVGDQKLTLAPDYVAGMHDGFRVIQVESVRLKRGGDAMQSAEMLAICLRMCGHLGTDPVMISALTAHMDFNRAMTQIEQAMSSKAFDDAALLMLADALDRISRRDPFGYIGAVVEARKNLAQRFTHVNSRDADQQARWLDAAELVKEWNAAQILHYEVVADTLKPTSTASASADAASATAPAVVPMDALARLADVLDPNQLTIARADAARIAPLIAQDNWNLFPPGATTPPVIKPDGVMRRFAQARSDVRKAMMLLNPAAPAADDSVSKDVEPASDSR